MARFEPHPGDLIRLNSATYHVMRHPGYPEMAFGQEGRKAIVYQLREARRLFAFKIFKPRYRQPELIATCEALSQLNLPGLEVCERQCLTRSTANSLVAQYKELEYAILMPWIDGTTWFDIILSETSIGESESQELAKSTASLLVALEQRGFAHCDIAGTNVIVSTATGAVNLIDVEDMYGPGLPPPSGFPKGTNGYQHQAARIAKQGQWCAEGDRFSAAVLLVEMLTWHHPDIRREADDEHYFAEEELQDPGNRRYELMMRVLTSISRPVAECFEAAWRAPTLAAAPTLGEWANLLEAVQVPLLPKEQVREALSRYRCTVCAAQFEQPAAGGRCPRCGAKRIEQAQLAAAPPPTQRAIWGIRCQVCSYEAQRPSAGGRCPNCGSIKVVQAVIQATQTPSHPVDNHQCPRCVYSFAQFARGGRCPNCGTRFDTERPSFRK